jgi:putative aldouronate transport system substrate-binding protein
MIKRSRLSFLLAAVLIFVLVLSACNSAAKTPTTNSPAVSDAAATPAPAPVETAKPAEKEVTLKLYFPGDKKSATDEVWAAVSDYVKTKGLNVKFDINFIPFADYNSKMLVLSASGDNWDGNFDGNWLAYNQMAAKGAYLDIKDLLPKFAPNLFKTYQDQGTLKAATVKGAIVALPWTMKSNERKYFEWRSDLAEKANIKPAADAIKTIDDIDKFLHDFKKAYPDQKINFPAVGLGGTNIGNLAQIFTQRDELLDLNSHNLFVDLNDPKLQVKPIEQTQAFKDSVTLAKKWYNDGIIAKDALVSKEDPGKAYYNGKVLVSTGRHEEANQNTPFVDKSWTSSFSLLYPDKKFANRTALANVFAINKNAKNPEQLLRLLDLMETDQKTYDLVQYGIEGKTYVLDGKTANYPAGMTNATSSYQDWTGQWALWKPQFMRPNTVYSEGFWVREGEFAKQANNIASPLDGLFITDDNFKTEAAKRDQLFGELGRALEAGAAANTDKALEDYIAKQKAAGLDKIIADVQKQIDAFVASSK